MKIRKLKCIRCGTELERWTNGITYCPKCKKIRIGGVAVKKEK